MSLEEVDMMMRDDEMTRTSPFRHMRRMATARMINGGTYNHDNNTQIDILYSYRRYPVLMYVHLQAKSSPPLQENSLSLSLSLGVTKCAVLAIKSRKFPKQYQKREHR